ncbi:MAG TPA: hypothetical protein VFY84_18365 [Jiangellales bacterium]|nr:hypothetical protein [Jiangellales bacterium]
MHNRPCVIARHLRVLVPGRELRTDVRLAHRYRSRFTPLTAEEAKLLLETARENRLYNVFF